MKKVSLQAFQNECYGVSGCRPTKLGFSAFYMIGPTDAKPQPHFSIMMYVLMGHGISHCAVEWTHIEPEIGSSTVEER